LNVLVDPARLVSTLLLEHRASGYSQSYFLYYYMFSWVVELITINKFIHVKNKQKTYNINNQKQVIDLNNFI
ncbi:MAG: hypothetical protein ACK4KY_07115, partial [Acinetobacter junii]